jgi:hypothetical protein
MSEPDPTIPSTVFEGVNVAIGGGFSALAGVLALIRELKATIGDEAAERVRAVMLARLGEVPLPDQMRAAIQTEIQEGF